MEQLTPLKRKFLEDTPISRKQKKKNIDSQEDLPFITVSLTENRNREIGVACMNTSNYHVELSQFSDNHVYSSLYTLLSFYQPIEIIIPSTSVESEMVKFLRTKFTRAKFTSCHRKFFNETQGQVVVKQLAVTTPVQLESTSKYLCLASLAALLKYVEFSTNTNFAANSLVVEYHDASEKLTIDSDSIRNLEIVANLRTGSKTESLYGVLNYTCTPGGARKLLSNLVQPPSDISTIQLRYDAVQVLLGKVAVAQDLRRCLQKFLDMDQIIGFFIKVPKAGTGTNQSELSINKIISLVHVLGLVQELIAGLQLLTTENELIQTILKNFNDSTLDEAKKEIFCIINEEIMFTTSNAQMKRQQAFAVKPEINGLLDVARKTYQENIDDIVAEYAGYKEEYHLPSLKLQRSVRRGYYFTLPVQANPMIFQMPKEFIQVSKVGKSWHCTTEKIISLSSKNQESLNEIFLLTNRIVEDLLFKIREYLPSLYKLSDSLGLLDMLLCFTQFAIATPGCVRPEISEDGPIAIKQGHHPIIQKLFLEPFVPNDVYISKASNFQIITGPNMSGKSTYIRQTVLLLIMAHAGFFIPAQYIAFRIIDKIFTRIGTEDSIENNCSSFFKEMSELNFILEAATKKSFVIIDELGRSTSNIDGVSLSWSIAEALCKKKLFCMFVTHFAELIQLSDIYPNVKNYHLAVYNSGEKINFTYTLNEGHSSAIEHSYGIDLAQVSGINQAIITEATEIRTALHNEIKERDANKETGGERAVCTLGKKIISIQQNSTLDLPNLAKFLKTLKIQHFQDN